MNQNFNTSHVTVYLDQSLKFRANKYISIHLMLLFIAKEHRLQNLWKNFNTSHVTVYLLRPPNIPYTLNISIHLMLLFIAIYFFIFSSSITISIHLMLLFITANVIQIYIVCQISIHLMLLFISVCIYISICLWQFQYISCYCLSRSGLFNLATKG